MAVAAVQQQQQQHSQYALGAVSMQLDSSATSALPPAATEPVALQQQQHCHSPPSPEQPQPAGAAGQCIMEVEPAGSCPPEPMPSVPVVEAQQTMSNGSSGSMGMAVSLHSTDTLKGRPVSPSSPLSDGMF